MTAVTRYPGACCTPPDIYGHTASDVRGISGMILPPPQQQTQKHQSLLSSSPQSHEYHHHTKTSYQIFGRLYRRILQLPLSRIYGCQSRKPGTRQLQFPTTPVRRYPGACCTPPGIYGLTPSDVLGISGMVEWYPNGNFHPETHL